MADSIVAKYTLRYNDLASKKLLRTAAVGRVLTKSLKFAALASGALAVAGATAAIRYANSWAKATDELGKFSKKSGVAIGRLSQLQTAMELQGGSTSDVQTGIETLNKRIGELRLGTGALHTILKKSDPAFAAQLKGVKSTDEAMTLAIDKLAGLTNAQDRAAFSAALFGRTAGGGFDLLTKDGVAGLQALMKEVARVRPPLTDAQAQIAARYNDQLTLAKQAMLSLGDAGSGKLLPTLTDLAERFTEFVASNRELINSKITGFMAGFSALIAKIDFDKTVESLKGFGRGLLKVMGYAERFVDAIGGSENAVKLFAASIVAAKIAPFIGVITSVISVGGKLIPVLKFMGVGAFALGKALIPLIVSIGIIPIAIAAVVAGLIWMALNFDKVKAFAKSLGLDLDVVWDNVKAGFDKLLSGAKVAWDAIQFAISNPIAAMKAIVVGHINVLSGIWSAVMNGIKSVGSTVWEAIKGIFSGGVEFLMSKVRGLLDFYNSVAKKVGLAQIGNEGPATAKPAPRSQRSNLDNRPAFARDLSGLKLSSLQAPAQPPARVAAGSTNENVVTVRAEKGTEVANISGSDASFTRDGENFTFGKAA